MATRKVLGIPYHLWNPYTPMDQFMAYLGFGPTVIVRGEGHYLYNGHGKRYLNGNSATWNCALGYGRRELIDAAARQMAELPFSSCWGMSHPRAIELAARLVEITSGRFSHVYLGCTGSEAVETALKMARQYHRQSPDPADRGRYKVISLHGGYHGCSYCGVSASGEESDAAHFGPLLPGYVQIEPPYCYRCTYGPDPYPACGLKCGHALAAKIEQEGPETVAAFILEPVMGWLGTIVPPPEYYRIVGETCRRYGVLLVADEVSTGFGRTGKLFASEDWDPRPDLLCLGKIISGGYLPLSATLATEGIYQRFSGPDRYFTHGSTNSGHPVCAAVGLAAIDIILTENLPQNAARVGEHLLACLQELRDRHEIIGDVRGRGLMLGLELVTDRQTRTPLPSDELFNIILDVVNRGLLITLDSLRLMPPLNIDERIADEMVGILDKALRTGTAARIGRTARLVKEFAVSKLPQSAR